jgi:hypothetical protein
MGTATAAQQPFVCLRATISRAPSKVPIFIASTPWYDEEVGEHICLTPSEIIELAFEVVATALPVEAWRALEEAITAREKSEEFVTQNTRLYNARNYGV